MKPDSIPTDLNANRSKEEARPHYSNFAEDLALFNCTAEYQRRLHTPYFTSSVTRNPLEQSSLQRLIEVLQSNKIKDYTKRSILEEYYLWAAYSFPDSLLIDNFCKIIKDFLKKNNTGIDKTIMELDVYLHFNGTNNPMNCKRNAHSSHIAEVLNSATDGISIEIPGVGSDTKGLANPQNMLLSLIQASTYALEKSDVLKLREIEKALKSTLPKIFSKLTTVNWIKSGEGTFSQVLYALQRVLFIQQRYPNARLNLKCYGHSRGSVSGLLFSREIETLVDKQALNARTSIEHYFTDPVPGGDNTEKNYENGFTDTIYDFFLRLHGREKETLISALRKMQPACVRRAVVTYASGETRFYNDLIRPLYLSETSVYYLMLPAPHSGIIYGAYPLSIYNLGWREDSLFVRNMGLESHTNSARDEVWQHYRQILNYFESEVEIEKKTIGMNLIAQYASFLVKGFDVFTLTQVYMGGQSSTVRYFDPEIKSSDRYKGLFYDKFHETLFSQAFPNLYRAFESLSKKGMVFFHRKIRENPVLLKEFQQLPRSMQYLFLAWSDEQSEMLLPETSETRRKIDTSLSYVVNGVGLAIGDARDRELLLRKTLARKGLSLERKKEYLTHIHALLADNKKPEEKHHQKYEKGYKYGDKDDIVFCANVLAQRLEMLYDQTGLEKDRFKSKKISLEIELIEALLSYTKISRKNPPTPLYFFRHKAPHLLVIYRESLALQACWHSKTFKQQGLSIDDQLEALSFKEFMESVDYREDRAKTTKTFTESFTLYCAAKPIVENTLGYRVIAVQDIDDRPREVANIASAVLSRTIKN